MRNLFLALVLANLAFAAWHTWFSGEPRPSTVARPDMPGITLVSELDEELGVQGGPGAADPAPTGSPVAGAAGPATGTADPNASVSRQAGPGAAADGGEATEGGPADTPNADLADQPNVAREGPPNASRCVSVGPFRELSQAATAAANLRAAGYDPAQRVAEGEVWVGYWVYISGIATEAQANEILARLRDNGVTDSYVIPGSDSGNLVSLGVFSEISRAGNRREEVRALGYEPTVTDRTRRATVYWVDVVLRADQSLDFETLQTPGRILRLEQRSCESPAA
jgi:cell division septation protein DedD